MSKDPIVGPRHVYKMCQLQDGTPVEVTLYAPAESTLVETDYRAQYKGQLYGTDVTGRLMRADRLLVIKINPVNQPNVALMRAYSMRTPTVVYEVGKWIESPLDLQAGRGFGIHFFLDQKVARIWPSLFRR